MPSPNDCIDSPRAGLPLGHWRGISFRIGWSYLGLGLALIVAAWMLKTQPGNQDLPRLAFVVWCAVGIIGLAQEIAHGVAAKLLGGKTRLIMIAGHGGAGQYQIFGGTRQAMVAGVGPASSVSIAIVLAGILLARGDASPLQMLDPLRPPELVGRLDAVSVAKVFAWVALTLSIVQMLPLWRCDGRTLLDGLVAAMRPKLPSLARDHISTMIIGWIAFAFVALSLAVAMLEDRQGVPRWPLIAAVGLVLSLSSRKVDPRIQLLNTKDKPIGWLATRRIRRAHSQEIREALDISQLDGILDRMNQHGIDSLTNAQRATLRRASQTLKKQTNDS